MNERFVEADGFRIRYWEDGQGTPLVYLHGAGGPRPNPSHDLLARRFRVVALEMPGFGESPENTRTQSMAELAATMHQAIKNLGIDTFNLIGRSFGGTTALWMTMQAPERVVVGAGAGVAVVPAGGRRPVGRQLLGRAIPHGLEERDLHVSGATPSSRVHSANHWMTSLWSGMPFSRRFFVSSASERPG